MGTGLLNVHLRYTKSVKLTSTTALFNTVSAKYLLV